MIRVFHRYVLLHLKIGCCLQHLRNGKSMGYWNSCNFRWNFQNYWNFCTSRYCCLYFYW